MLTKKSRLLVALTAATPLLFAACYDHNITDPFNNAAGTYDLTVFRGATLPVTDTYPAGQFATLPNGGTVRWTDGTMVLYNNGTFVETNNYVVTPNGQSSSSGAFVSSGTYTLDGEEFTLSAPAQSQTAARFASGTLTADPVYRINYQEQNESGGFDSYEYIRR